MNARLGSDESGFKQYAVHCCRVTRCLGLQSIFIHTRRQCPAIWLAVVYNSERCLRKVLLEEMIHPCMFPEIQIQEYNSCCNRYWSRKHELYTDNTSTIKKLYLPSMLIVVWWVANVFHLWMIKVSSSQHIMPHRGVMF